MSGADEILRVGSDDILYRLRQEERERDEKIRMRPILNWTDKKEVPKHLSLGGRLDPAAGVIRAQRWPRRRTQ